MTTVIKHCTCKSAYQDKSYDGQRLHNVAEDGSTRCTVCGTLKSSTIGDGRLYHELRSSHSL